VSTVPAFGQSTPSGGAVKVWGVLNASNKPSAVVITGAIADYGTTQSVNSSGKPDENGNNVKVTLKKGTFTVDTSQLNSALNSAQPTDFNATNCSASETVSSVTVPIVSGSGTSAYKGISGSLNMSAMLALILPKTKSGSCNMSNSATPVATWGAVTGTGTVSFG
jgi:hypothetical protein